MSTPRPWTCTCAGRDKKVWHADPTCEVHGEGVAAPLEPSPLEWFERNANQYGVEGVFREVSETRVVFTDERGEPIPIPKYFMGNILRAYAAAVSKNLQEELARAKQYGKTEYGIELVLRQDLGEARDRIADLEKEITALREKP